MADIRIRKLRDRAFLYAVTENGDRWIRSNMHRVNGEPAKVINSEFADELADDIRKDGIGVEVV